MQSLIYRVDEVHIEGLIVIPENPPAIAVSAKGKVPTSGWTAPDLAPRVYIIPPEDGILDLDFLATPPTGLALQVISPIAVTKVLLVPKWVVGVRVHSSTNFIEALIEGAGRPSKDDIAGKGMPLPWPFPWWAPHSKTA